MGTGRARLAAGLTAEKVEAGLTRRRVRPLGNGGGRTIRRRGTLTKHERNSDKR